MPNWDRGHTRGHISCSGGIEGGFGSGISTPRLRQRCGGLEPAGTLAVPTVSSPKGGTREPTPEEPCPRGKVELAGEVTVAMALGSDARRHVTSGCHGARPRRRGRSASRSDVPRLPPHLFSRPSAPSPLPPAGSPRPRRFHCTTRWRRRRRAELAGLPGPERGEPGRRAACCLRPPRGPRPPPLLCPRRLARRVPQPRPPAGRCLPASATTRSTAPSARATSLWSSGPRTSSPRPR